MSSSWLSKVDPLMKIAFSTLWVAASVYFSLPGLCVLAGGATLLFYWSGVYKRPIVLLWVFSSLIGLGLMHLIIGGEPQEALHTVLRLYALGAGSLPLMLTTDPADLMRSLKRLKMPSGILLGLSIMWRSLPMLKRELEAILFSAKLDGEKISPLRPRRFFRRVLVPLSFGLIGFADEISLALMTRGISLDGERVRISKPLRRVDFAFGAYMIFCISGATGTLWL